MKYWSPAWVWALLTGVSLMLFMVPWMPPLKGKSAAQVDLDNCNGCGRCSDDCPFGAITMEARSDGKAYETEAVVDPSLCMSCGLCTGSCPTATPFRRHSALSPGIDMPELTAALIRENVLQASEKLQGDRRVMVFTCRENARKISPDEKETAVVELICAGQLPPPFIDFVLSRKLADGVVLAGCAGGDCQYRFGAEWSSQRVERQRDPQLRKRVDTSHIGLGWQEPWSGIQNLTTMVAAFRDSLPAGAENEKQPLVAGEKATTLRIPVAVASYAAFALIVGCLSVWPRFQLIDAGEAMVSLSFSHAGQRIRECRQLTQEELNELPPNMRKPTDCPRERLPVRVVFSSDGDTLYEETRQPAGLWKDGSANVYRRMRLEAGKQRLFVGMNERGEPGEFDYSLEEEVDLEPGQHLVVEFDPIQKSFLFRQE
jgi:ferredoxin/coenzyme F420-reducing hydrogenase delta subunit